MAPPPPRNRPFLCADLLATLGARVHVVALERVFDGYLVQRLLKREDRGDEDLSAPARLSGTGGTEHTHIDVLHVGHLTSDGVELLRRLTDVVTVLQDNTKQPHDGLLLHGQPALDGVPSDSGC